MTEFVLPTGTVSLMLADIEGSVRLWEARSDRMPEAMTKFDQLVERVIDRHSGVRPREQGEGDSFVAAFARPSEAVACALALQLGIAQQEWGETDFRLRIALHTGEVEFRDEANYVGSTINRCARLRDIAHGGQTLLSGSTYDLIAERLPESASVKDLGTHRLRDLSRPEHVYQLLHPALPEEFPTLRSLEALPNNLPVQLTSFVGREKEIEEVNGLLKETRMLTLSGSGGCGKTRLAIQVAADLVDEYEGGVWLVDLASVREPDLVVGAFALAIGVQEKKDLDPLQTVIEHLASARSLVIIDNCEHLIAACAEVSGALLKGCPPLTLVATSREPLGIPGETTWRVPSLSLPPEETEPVEIETLTEYEAARLFVDRAVKSRPNFKVTNDNAPAVAQICFHLDGIPLAIELAAARVKVLTPQQISDGLSDRFRLLTGGGRSVMPRQQTLQASVDWSYQLLTQPERVVLDCLSVFSGGFTLDAAEAVCPSDGVQPEGVLDLLERLVDKSLVVVEEEEGPAARYHLLETIRQFAMERLVEKGSVEEVRTRHMQHFLELGKVLSLEDPKNVVFGVPPEAGPEVDNYRAATRWALAGEDHESSVRLATQLGWILMALGQRREIERLLQKVMESCDDAPPDVLSRAWTLRGWAMSQNLDRTTLACGERALQLAEEVGDERASQAARALIAQGALSINDMAKVEWVIAQMEQSAGRGSFEHIFAVLARAASLMNAGELAKGKTQFEEAVELSRGSNNLGTLSTGQLHLGFVSFLQGDFESARNFAVEAEETDRLLSLPDPRTSWLFGLVDLYRGDYSAAKQRLEDSLSLSRQQQVLGLEVCAVVGLAVAALAERDNEGATRYRHGFKSLTESVEEPQPDVVFFAVAHRVVSEAFGRERLEKIRELAARSGAQLVVAMADHQEAKIHRGDAQFNNADSLAFEALAIFHRAGAKGFVVESLELAGGLAADQDSFEEAARLFAAAEAARQDIGYVRFGVDQPQYESDLARVKEALAGNFQTVWQEGAGLSLDDAVAYALRGRGERKRPSAGWAALTPAELRVTGLVAEGLSNPKIAERLFISRHTVETHVKNIFAKLGISSRAQLAGEASRRGLDSERTP